MTDLKKITTGYTISQHPEPCIGKDPRCPCQDGDACHYKDCGGTKAVPVAQPEQEPGAWSVIDPAGNILATEKNAIRGWARVNGYKLTVEGLLGLHELGWRVLPTSPPAAQLEPTPWREMVVATLVREGVNKHKARELADHFAAERNNG